MLDFKKKTHLNVVAVPSGVVTLKKSSNFGFCMGPLCALTGLSEWNLLILTDLYKTILTKDEFGTSKVDFSFTFMRSTINIYFDIS